MNTYGDLTPWGVTSFADLKKANLARNSKTDMYNTLIMFAEMAERVISGDYYDKEGEEQDMYTKLSMLGEEFVSEVALAKSRLEKDFKAPVDENQFEDLFKETGDVSEAVVINNSVALYKNAKNELIWAGIHTNKFKDRDGDIISDQAHRDFVKKVYDGEYPFPELWVWHIPKAVGETNWLAYDERGFLLSGGKVFKEFEDLVTTLVENNADVGLGMGMSHGMPINTVEFEDNLNDKGVKVIKQYKSVEISMLPIEHASNLLTDFSAYRKSFKEE